jgi:hypothetical protein
MTDEMLDSVLREEIAKTLRAIDEWAARMEPLLKMIADTHANILKLVAEQERLRQAREKRA